jgi:hypothetical protein
MLLAPGIRLDDPSLAKYLLECTVPVDIEREVHNFCVNVLLWQQNIEDVHAYPLCRLARGVFPCEDIRAKGSCQITASSQEDMRLYFEEQNKYPWLTVWTGNRLFPSCAIGLLRMQRFDYVKLLMPVTGHLSPYHSALVYIWWLLITGHLTVDKRILSDTPFILSTILARIDAYRGTLRKKTNTRFHR